MKLVKNGAGKVKSWKL